MPIVYVNSGSIGRLEVTSSLLVLTSFQITGSISSRDNFSGSLFGTSSWSSNSSSGSYVLGSIFVGGNPVLSASIAITASHVVNPSSAFPFSGSAEITGSLAATGSFSIRSGSVSGFTTITGSVSLLKVSQSLNFNGDAAAASAGVPLGGLYRTGSTLKIRIV